MGVREEGSHLPIGKGDFGQGSPAIGSLQVDVGVPWLAAERCMHAQVTLHVVGGTREAEVGGPQIHVGNPSLWHIQGQLRHVAATGHVEGCGVPQGQVRHRQGKQGLVGTDLS